MTRDLKTSIINLDQRALGFPLQINNGKFYTGQYEKFYHGNEFFLDFSARPIVLLLSLFRVAISSSLVYYQLWLQISHLLNADCKYLVFLL